MSINQTDLDQKLTKLCQTVLALKELEPMIGTRGVFEGVERSQSTISRELMASQPPIAARQSHGLFSISQDTRNLVLRYVGNLVDEIRSGDSFGKEIVDHLTNHNPITAIKRIREVYNLGLLEAKTTLEVFRVLYFTKG